jgi:putative endonuclease
MNNKRCHPERAERAKDPLAVMKQYYVYIMTNRNRGVLYTGVTNDLVRRVYEHKNKFIKGFSSHYNTTILAYFEETPDAITAIGREKHIKGWL